MKDLGLYIHIPFCKSKCYYCDFCMVANTKKEDDYLKRLICENEQIADKLTGYVIKTVYIGGGTPSYVSEEKLCRTVSTILSKYNKDIEEFTIEINPDSISENKLLSYKKMGVNRVSIGVQTLNNDLLKAINRPHTDSDAIESIILAKKYFDNISCDLMIGLPNQTIKDCKSAIETLFSLGVNHISCYTLQLEDNTVLKKMVESGKITLPTDDETADIYEYCCNLLKKLGYDRYEISNFCLGNTFSRHNYSYWDRVDYLGLGASACSLINGYRFGNTNNISKYIVGAEQENVEKLSIEDEEFESIMLSFRTEKGLCLSKFKTLYKTDFTSKYQKQLARLENYLEVKGDYIKIKDEFFEVSNEIIVEFMP